MAYNLHCKSIKLSVLAGASSSFGNIWHSPKRRVSPVISSNATVSDTSVHLEEIKSKLPWLPVILNENGSISISYGTFELGFNATILDEPECEVSSTNSTGVCTLIHKCPQMYPVLKDAKTFETYFCDLNGYAGVCCSKIEDSTAAAR